MEDSLQAMLQLSDPSVFMMLGMAEVKILNDLIFVDYLTDDSNAFSYVTNLLRQMVCDREAPDCAQNMKLPLSMNS
eukprot:9321670-Karenia_brevis.AAC.1